MRLEYIPYNSLAMENAPDIKATPRLCPCLRFTESLRGISARLGAEWIASPFS
jgi:hypothetical protein